MAQQNQDAEVTTDVVEESPLTTLGDEYHNSIKLLQNRFRIDYKVDEITLVFFRVFGSAPVVLVRPDGSKIFSTQADGEDIFWYDANTYDMISIKNPTPGPWQAVGQILPGSRVMVLSDIRLHAEPLPPMIFSGEILKQTAYLTNGGEPINYSEFRDVVDLTIELGSTNNPNYNNFGAKSELVATFVDNGLGMDEAPLDGTFTGQFNLAIAAGEWQPIFRVSTPMFTREQIDEPLVLHPNPIEIDVQFDGGGEGYHKLLIDAKRDLVDISSLLIDGKIRFPNGDIQNFSLTELSDKTREHLVVNYEYGVFRVKLTAYGKTVNGRDFILDVPEYTFVAEEPVVEAPEPVVEGNEEQMTEADIALAEMMIADEPEPEESVDVIFWILVINGSIIVIALCVLGFVMWRKRSTTDSVSDGLMAKLRGLLPNKKTP
ncbi:TIGR03503 family protein [Alteromonas sp. ASW11-36]|uniref:TIGR03503 family protein n=1 Tax=Alteromonas arenosi TaxID=3055817 RepID=A0ABT7SXY0_9ALTE|nr:TIGR03503 family protein [Alteromonas sp. ASW11-36]MDM7861051.1 TIGR03503 family protein [Alteromonas sp. ASW11-36]